jgi:hypothetical protein
MLYKDEAYLAEHVHVSRWGNLPGQLPAPDPMGIGILGTSDCLFLKVYRETATIVS